MGETYVYRRMMIQREVGGKGQLHVGYDALVLLVIAVFMNTFILLQFFQSPDVSSDLIMIALIQVTMGIGGFSAGALINRDILDVSFPNRKRVMETYVHGLVAATFVMVIDVIVLSIYPQAGLMEALSVDINIPLVAGVVEEALFSLTIAMLLYKVFKEIFKHMGMMGEAFAIGISSLFTAAFFAMIHLWVYRRVMEALVLMFINRIVYTVVFLKYKNFSMVMMMHIYHNAIAMIGQ